MGFAFRLRPSAGVRAFVRRARRPAGRDVAPEPKRCTRLRASRPWRGTEQSSTRNLVRGLGLALGLGLLAACAYQGAIDQPVTQKLTWFSYLNGDDIRASCRAGAPSWYRLVYNGSYDQQLRSYEVIADGAGGAYYKARVQGPGGIDLTRLSLRDLQAPARWTTAQDWLDRAGISALEAALERSGAFRPAPRGLRLASEEFYWIAAICRGGVFFFNAWRYPSDRFAALSFPEVLLRHDGTGVKVNPPREVTAARFNRRTVRGEGGPIHFDLEAGDNGIKGHGPLF